MNRFSKFRGFLAQNEISKNGSGQGQDTRVNNIFGRRSQAHQNQIDEIHC